MRCKLCRQPIQIKRTFFNFFDQVPYEICYNCFKARQNIDPYFVIPSQGGLIHVFEILTELEGDAGFYFQYLKSYFMTYLSINADVPLIYLDHLDEDLLSLINQLNINLIILTLKYKEE